MGEQPRRIWSTARAGLGEALASYRAIVGFASEIVHLQLNYELYSPRFLLALAGLCRLGGIPVVATVHGRLPVRWSARVKAAAILASLRGADLVVHNAAHAREIGTGRVHVIPHGVCPARTADPAAARRALGLPSEGRLLAHFGFIHPDKGIAAMLRAIAGLRRHGQRDLHYSVAGGTFGGHESRDHLEELRRLARELGIEGCVRLSGEYRDGDAVLAELEAADWIVLNYATGNRQGTSGAARHALCAGRPLAVSRAPIFDDLRDVALTLAEPLEATLARLLADAELSAEMTRRAARYCEENSWSRIADRHADLYQRAVHRAHDA